MSKLYIININSTIDRDKVIKFLDDRKLISFWFFTFPYSFFAESENTARVISEAISLQFGNPTHFIGEVSKQNYYGRMEESLWKSFYKK